tara:strand:+ start:1605 stop:2672 length:1068 start_codon:yes stop_codon:yes gene_type:complete
MNLDTLNRLILEAYSEVSEDKKDTIKIPTLPKAMQDRLRARYGEFHENDFISSDMGTYFKTTNVNKTTGQVSHKIIALPSFASMYNDYKDIVADIKSLMRSDDIRKDKAARELFELIKTNFRKLQRYLRTERPEQYDLIRMRASLQESINMFKSHTSLITEETLWKQLEEAEEDEPVEDETPQSEDPKEGELPDATDTILGRFPTVKAAIIRLQTEEYKEFVDSIDWISPRPTAFRVNLKNGQDYILKWTGKAFQAQIMGKRYLLSNIADYQQALDKLSILYKEAPMSGAGEAAEVDDTGGGGGGGGDFPGGEAGGAEGGEEGGEADIPAGDDAPAADLGGEEIDFEDAGEEPEA